MEITAGMWCVEKLCRNVRFVAGLTSNGEVVVELFNGDIMSWTRSGFESLHEPAPDCTGWKWIHPDEQYVAITDENHVLRRDQDEMKHQNQPDTQWAYCTREAGKRIADIGARWEFRCKRKDMPVKETR